MNVELRQVTEDEKEILKNLIEKYCYEFSQWDKCDVNKLGLYGYPCLDHYWTESGRWAYFILVDEKLAGFVMLIDRAALDDRDADFQVAEFFVMYKYRHLGVGKQAFYKLLESRKGRWQVKEHPANTAAALFWGNIIDFYTKGHYELVKAYPHTAFEDGTLADVFFFEN